MFQKLKIMRLKRNLKSDDPQTRIEALQSLVYSYPDHAFGYLIKTLDSERFSDQVIAAKLLKNTTENPSIQAQIDKILLQHEMRSSPPDTSGSSDQAMLTSCR